MNGLILSTKGTAKNYRNRGIIGGLILCMVGLFLTIIYGVFRSRSSAQVLVLILILGLLIIFDGFYTIMRNCIFSTTYLDIYSDRISGKGAQKLNMQNFNAGLNQISNITVNGICIDVSIGANTYRIFSDKETASKVLNYYGSYIACIL